MRFAHSSFQTQERSFERCAQLEHVRTKNFARRAFERCASGSAPGRGSLYELDDIAKFSRLPFTTSQAPGTGPGTRPLHLTYFTDIRRPGPSMGRRVLGRKYEKGLPPRSNGVDVTQHSLPNELCHDTSDSESVPNNGQARDSC